MPTASGVVAGQPLSGAGTGPSAPWCCLLVSPPGRRCLALPLGRCQVSCNILKQPLKRQMTKLAVEMETLLFG